VAVNHLWRALATSVLCPENGDQLVDVENI
jgi:hypothetical protein